MSQINKRFVEQLVVQVINAQGETLTHKQFFSDLMYKTLNRLVAQGFDFDSPQGKYSCRLIAMPLSHNPNRTH